MLVLELLILLVLVLEEPSRKFLSSNPKLTHFYQNQRVFELERRATRSGIMD
jgi:hypothetical protein